MEIQTFARQILETGDLEAKLRPPSDELTDHDPGAARKAPSSPGRPPGLQFHTLKQRHPLPGPHQLDGDEEQRGLLLHFFANHELLATELMALVLLKFPDAPAEFRRGVLATLLEEQRHTRMYLARMEDCGVRFGDLPVSGYFWNSVAPMETPLDYVTRLSLTFEQANLDYSRHYADIFSKVGDNKTAAILERIHRDEIGHVGYGLQWFRRWKKPNQTDWEAFESSLAFPLSPSRAKAGGAPFNTRARLEAGLDEDFVRHLELFQRSRGRTPHVYWFAPDEEAAMAGSLDARAYHPRAALSDLAADLEILPAFLARRDDVVLLHKLPSPAHLRYLRDHGFTLPEFEALAKDGRLRPDSLIRTRKLGGLRPWGWGPRSARLLEPLLANLPGGNLALAACWNEQRRALYSKAADLALLQAIARDDDAIDPKILGTLCTAATELDSALERIAGDGFEHAYLKGPFGASAQRNQLIALPLSGDAPARTWAESILAQQGALIAEPALERVLDFSIQFDVTGERLRRLGIVRLHNDTRGQFRSAATGPKASQDLEPDLAEFFATGALAAFDEEGPLARHLHAALREASFTGPLGIDSLIYRDPASASLRLKPIVEINPRYTMGRLALELRRFVSPSCALALELAPTSLALRSSRSEERDAQGKINHGTLCLNDPARARHFQALLHVAPKMRDLPLLQSSVINSQ